MPRWGTDEDYNPDTEMLITKIELSPFALRYECEYDNSFKTRYDRIWSDITKVKTIHFGNLSIDVGEQID